MQAASTLSLYPVAPRQPIERVAPRAFDSDCSRCSLRAGAKNIVRGEAMDAPGERLFVVGEGPGRNEDAEGRPFCGKSGAKMRPLLRKFWSGAIALDNATRCFPGAGKEKQEVGEQHIASCRPYLADAVQEFKPGRIVLMGNAAVYSVLGRTVQLVGTRRGYTWLWQDGQPIPVFILLHPAAGLRNHFLWRYFAADLEWACKARLPAPKQFAPEFVAHLVDSPAAAEHAARELQRGEGFAFDLEWAGHQYDPDFKLLTLAACAVGHDSVFVWDEKALRGEETYAPLRRLLEDPEQPKGGSNVKADLHALWCGKKTRVRGVTFDVRLQRKLLEPEASGYLEDMADLVGMGGHKAEAKEALQHVDQRIKRMAAAQRASRQTRQDAFGFADELDTEASQGFDPEKYEADPRAIAHAFLPRDMLLRYVCRDALTTARLASRLSLDLHRSPERNRVWEKIVLPAASAIQRVEEWGVPFDAQAGALFGQLMQKGMDEAHQRVQKYAPAGGVLNVASPDQLARVLYDDLRLPVPFQTAGGDQPSTDEEALKRLQATGHPLPGYILQFRHYQKLVGYTADWARCVRGDGRIHGSINLDGARSGRTSMSDPNLQNIPRVDDRLPPDQDDGKRARDCFRAPRGYVLLQLDYSQLELRVASYIARDRVMADLFRSGVDFHLGTAKLISKLAWGIEPDQVGKAHRTAAKTVNFALAYGKTVRTLAAELGISLETAQAVVDAILGKFADFKRWSREAIGYAREHGGCWTFWEDERARWRPLWRIGDDSEENAHAASKARNGAINSPVQGTASEFCVASIGKLVQAIEAGALDAELVLPIHDSVMLVCPEKTWKDTAQAAKATMENYPWFTKHCPLVVDIEVGERWGSLEKVKLAA